MKHQIITYCKDRLHHLQQSLLLIKTISPVLVVIVSDIGRGGNISYLNHSYEDRFRNLKKNEKERFRPPESVVANGGLSIEKEILLL